MLFVIIFSPLIILLLCGMLATPNFRRTLYINVIIILTYNIIGWIYFLKVLNYEVNGLAGAAVILLITNIHSLILLGLVLLKRYRNNNIDAE